MRFALMAYRESKILECQSTQRNQTLPSRLALPKARTGLSNNALLTAYACNGYSDSREECEM